MRGRGEEGGGRRERGRAVESGGERWSGGGERRGEVVRMASRGKCIVEGGIVGSAIVVWCGAVCCTG
jgi:hypothetical protein